MPQDFCEFRLDPLRQLYQNLYLIDFYRTLIPHSTRDDARIFIFVVKGFHHKKFPRFPGRSSV